MKLLTIAIPCYNSSAYMRKCIDSLLPGGDDVEIIIVNDGSSDNTADIAEEYRERFPSIVKVVNKENGGHGSAVNVGIENASGLYFKVVDSDDWVSFSAYTEILKLLNNLVQGGQFIDMLISNFVYEKEGEKRKKVIHYHHALPEERVFTWKDVRHFRVGQYILMHSVIYRTNLLRECGLQLPEHTFYVDNIFVFQPLEVGCKKYFLEASEGRSWLGNMSYAFKNGYANVVASMLLMNVFIFLWGLLLIIPGIYKSYEYRMIPYLLAEDSNLSFSEAKRLSSEMMYGEKWDTFVLDLSFILWNFLSALTWGLVGIFWVNPYIQYTNVELYKVLRTKVPGPYYTGNNEW